MQAATQTNRTLGGLAYKWTVMIVVIFGLFMVVLDTTIVNIAIPRLQTDFDAPLASVQWVSTGYTLAQAVATPLTRFLSERLGLKRLYLLALALFTLGSTLCGLSWNLPVLIFFRILQGVGGAPLLPMSITLLYREFPLTGTWDGNWHTWHSDPAGASTGSDRWGLHRDLCWLALDLLPQRPHWHRGLRHGIFPLARVPVRSQ